MRISRKAKQWSNRIIFFSGPFTFFHHVGVRINSRLSTSIHVGGKKGLYSATKSILYTAGGSIFLLIGVLGIGLYGSNEPTFNFETLANQSYPVALEIIFYIGFLIAFAVKSPIIPKCKKFTAKPFIVPNGFMSTA